MYQISLYLALLPFICEAQVQWKSKQKKDELKSKVNKVYKHCKDTINCQEEIKN